MQPLLDSQNKPNGIAGVQGEDTNLWLDKIQLILKLQQAEKLLTAQSDLIDGTFHIFLKQGCKPHAVLQYHVSHILATTCPLPSLCTVQNSMPSDTSAQMTRHTSVQASEHSLVILSSMACLPRSCSISSLS